MKEYISHGWEHVLRLNKLENFDPIWNLDIGWFEEPNERRGGWSGVSKISLKTENGGSVGVFLKRQENHNTKAWSSPIRGMPTYYREFKNILRFIAKGLPTAEPVYFGYRFKNNKSQAILMTKELEGFESLDSDLYGRNGALMQDRVKRERIMEAVARVMRKLHDHHFRHNCLYSKHIFLRSIGKEWEVRIIDLEKLNRSLFKRNAIMRDLYTLPQRISGCWRRNDRLKFLKIYMQEDKLSSRSKLIWREIDNKLRARNKSLAT